MARPSSCLLLTRRATALAVLLAAATACDRPPDAEGPAPSAEERLADWNAGSEGAAIPVSLGFGEPRPDSLVADLLDRYELRPYAAYMTAAGMQGVQRRERSRASLELLGEAREQTTDQLRTSLCAQRDRARAMLAEPARPDPIPSYRAVLSHFLLLQTTLPQLELGAPLIYGLEAVGAIEQVRAVRADALVSSWEPGWRGRVGSADTVVVPQPPAPTGDESPIDAQIAALTPEEVRARMSRLAEDGMGACGDGSRPEADAR